MKENGAFMLSSIQWRETSRDQRRQRSVVNVTIIGKNFASMNPLIPVTFKIFNRNVNNCLVDLGASSNVMPYYVCKKLNVEHTKCATQIVQLDRSTVKRRVEGCAYLIIIQSSSTSSHRTHSLGHPWILRVITC